MKIKMLVKCELNEAIRHLNSKENDDLTIKRNKEGLSIERSFVVDLTGQIVEVRSEISDKT